MSDRIRVKTVRQQIRGVAAAWRAQYGDRPKIPHLADVLPRLEALDRETASAAEVDAIIGNPSWTGLRCDVCHEDCAAIVQLGDEPDYDSTTLDICGECLAAASAILAHVERSSLDCATKDFNPSPSVSPARTDGDEL